MIYSWRSMGSRAPSPVGPSPWAVLNDPLVDPGHPERFLREKTTENSSPTKLYNMKRIHMQSSQRIFEHEELRKMANLLHINILHLKVRITLFIVFLINKKKTLKCDTDFFLFIDNIKINQVDKTMFLCVLG